MAIRIARPLGNTTHVPASARQSPVPPADRNEWSLFQLLQLFQGNAFIHPLCHMISCNACTVPEAPTHTFQPYTVIHRQPDVTLRVPLFLQHKIFLPQITIGKIAFQPGDAAIDRLNNEVVCAPVPVTSSVRHRLYPPPGADRHRQLCEQRLINQTCFLFTADHLYRTTEDSCALAIKSPALTARRNVAVGQREFAREGYLADVQQTGADLPTALHCFIRQGIFAIQASSRRTLRFIRVSVWMLPATSRKPAYENYSNRDQWLHTATRWTHTLHPSICLCVGCILSPESLLQYAHRDSFSCHLDTV